MSPNPLKPFTGTGASRIDTLTHTVCPHPTVWQGDKGTEKEDRDGRFSSTWRTRPTWGTSCVSPGLRSLPWQPGICPVCPQALHSVFGPVTIYQCHPHKGWATYPKSPCPAQLPLQAP